MMPSTIAIVLICISFGCVFIGNPLLIKSYNTLLVFEVVGTTSMYTALLLVIIFSELSGFTLLLFLVCWLILLTGDILLSRSRFKSYKEWL